MDQVDYDKLLGNATERRDDMAAGPDTSMYDEILQKDDQQQNEQLMNSLFAVGGINPDQAAEAQKLGLELGVGPDIARRNMEELRRRSALMKAQEYKLTATSPILARQLTDPEFAAIAQDDLAHLTATEKTVQVMKNVGGTIASGFLKADAGTASAIRQGVEWYGGVADQVSGTLGFDTTGDNPAQSAAKWLDEYQQAGNKAAEAYGPRRDRMGLVERSIYSGIESATQMVATLPMLAASPAAYLATNVSIITGQEYSKARDKGLSPLPAGIYAMGQGAVEYATEKIPVLRLIEDLGGGSGLIKTIGRQMATEIPNEQAATIVQDLNEWAVLNPDKPFSAYLAERPSAAAETLIATIVATGAQTTLIKGAEAAFNKIDRAGADAWRANLMAENLRRLTDAATNSKLRQRSPDAYQKYVAAQTVGTPVENMYVDAAQLVEVLKQSNVSNGELDAMLPGLREQLAGAVLPGGNVVGDVKIPTAQYAARVAGTDFGNALMPHLRMGEDAVSEAEAGQFETLRQQMVDEAGKILEEKRATDDAFVKSAAEVESTLLEQLKATGIYTPEQSRAAATLQAATYTSLANQMGITPSEVYALLPYKQQAGAVAGQGAALSQAGTLSDVEDVATAENVSLAVSENKGVITLSKIVAGEQGKGSGTKVMQALVDYADATGQRIALSPSGDFGGSVPRLKEFYKRFGFAPNKGRSKDFSVSETMIREPQPRGTFDPNDPNILNQGDVEQPSEPVPAEAVNVASLESANALSKSKVWQTGRDLKVALQNAILRAVNGRNLLERTAANRAYLVDVGMKDALAALEQNANAIGWYDLKTRQALAVMSLVHPELATDETSRFAFTWALAVTSNGIKVGKNFELAEMVYSRWKASDKDPSKRTMPTDIKAGKAQGPINTALQTFNDLSQAWGLVPLRLFMLSNFKAGDIKAMTGIMPTGEWASTDVRGASIIGPKIGNGFFSNLYGKFDALTMDRWLVRTWGRWTGTLIEIDEANVQKSRERLQAALQVLDRDALATALRAVVKTSKKGVVTEIKPGDRDRLIEALQGDDLDAIANAVLRASQEPKFRSAMNGTPGGEELRKAGNSLAKYLDGQKEQPEGPGERVYIREVFGEILNRLRQDPRFADLTMSDLQAVLWYAEKRLYETAKEDIVAEDIAALEGDEVAGYDDEDAPDYANAAADVARSKGVTDRRINAALKKEQTSGRSGSAQPAAGSTGSVGGQPSGQGQQGQARGFTEGERRDFVQRRALDRVRSNRASDAESSWSYARGSGKDGRGVRLLKSLGATVVADWTPGKGLKSTFAKAGIATPTLHELEQGNAQNAERFVTAITDARATLGKIGEAVHVYPASDYAGLRLFLTSDGNAGFALKPDGDIVSVFSAKGTGAGRAVMETAIAAGGKKLDCFHTILPEFYSGHGFRGTSRLLWNDEVAKADMPNWDKEAFAKFNNGEPDVVFMVYDPDYSGSYDPQFTPLFKGKNDYGRALGAQNRALAAVAERAAAPEDALRQGPRGGYIPQRFTTLLNEKADVSTVFHEFSHFYLDALTRLVSNPAASEQMKADLKQLVEFAGATMEEWTAWTAEYDATGTIPEGMRRVHEAVAYNSEIYLFEGKAPAPELQGVFDRVVRWMKQVYTTIRDQLNAAYKAEFGTDLPMLTPEVRGVFDRMLASEAEIKQAEAIRNMGAIFTSQAESGMSPEEWAAYQVMLEEARDAAVTDLTKASLRQMQWLSNARGRILKQMQRAHEARRKEIRAEVEDEIKQRPVYRAMQFLKRGTIDGSEVEYPVKLSIPEIEAMYGDNPIVGLIKKGLGVGKYGMLASENAMHPDQVAEMFGFKSGDDLVRQLLAAPPMREAVAAETDARMLAENGEMTTPEALDAAVEAALHNEARARFVAVELRFLQKATEPVRLMLKAAQQIAKGMISKKVVKDIRPKEFAAAEARAARKSMDLIKDGKSKEAAQAKQAQLLQNQLAAEAIAAREEIAQAIQLFRKVFKSDKAIAKGRNLDLVNAARAILAAHGIGKADKAPVEYTKQLQAYNPELYAELEPLIIRASAGARAYDTLTMDEFRGMRDAVAALWFQARRDHQIEVDGKKMELDAVEAELNDRLVAIGIPERVDGEKEAVGAKERMVRHLFQGKALIRRVEHWADATDGPGGTGPFTRYIWRPMRKAIDAYRAQRNIYVKRYTELLAAVDLPVAKIAAPELGYTFGNANGGIGKAEVLGAMLHTGNESNLRKLLLGRGWGKELEDGTLDTSRWDAFRIRMINEGVLTKADFDFLQAVWNLTEELKPQAQKAHHDLFGYYFKEVEAKGFTTPFGAYRGGYVPAKVDPHMVRDAQVHQKMEDMESDFRNSMPSTGMGFTKGRVEYNKPLSLDVRLIARHIDDVIRFSHVQPVVKDVLRILRRRGFADNLTRIDPTAIEGMLLPWLNRAARQITMEAGKHKAVDRFWSAVRSRTGIGIMFANITNALQQVTGYFPALLKVKPTYLKGALVQYMSGLQGMTDEVARLSPFMADRMQNQMFDLQDTMNDLLLNPSRYDKVQKWAAHHGYFLQQAFQNQVDVVTWTATLNQTLAELGADKTDAEAMKEAVARADAAVRLTQSSLAPEDISAFEVGSPFYKTLIQFSGYFNMMANLNASEYTKIFRDLGWRGNKGRLFMAYLLGFGLPMLISDAIVRSLGGGWDDEDDDGYLDVFMSWFFGSQVRGAVALVPGAGLPANALFNALDDKPYNDRLSISPAITVLEAATFGTKAFVSNVINPEKDVTGKNVRDVLTLVSLITGIPVTVLGRPIGYQVDVAQGKVEPTSAVDYARGLLTGKASPSSRQ